MKRIVCLGLIGVFGISLFFTSCATIMGGGAKDKSERSAEIRWGYFIADIFLTGAIGLIVDFANGSIYESKNKKYSELENEMKKSLKNKMAGYVIKKDGLYKVKLLDDNKLEFNKVSWDEIPPQVRKSLELAIAK